jgi:hypothetical protein
MAAISCAVALRATTRSRQEIAPLGVAMAERAPNDSEAVPERRGFRSAPAQLLTGDRLWTAIRDVDVKLPSSTQSPIFSTELTGARRSTRSRKSLSIIKLTQKYLSIGILFTSLVVLRWFGKSDQETIVTIQSAVVRFDRFPLKYGHPAPAFRHNLIGDEQTALHFRPLDEMTHHRYGYVRARVSQTAHNKKGQLCPNLKFTGSHNFFIFTE